MIADILDVLASATATDLRPLQIKLTYVGPQTKSVPSIAFTTFYHVLDLDWFVGLRSLGLHYDNDDIAVWNFTVTPEEMMQVVGRLAKAGAISEIRELRDPHLSFTLAIRNSRIGDAAFEAVLDRVRAKVLIETIRNTLGPINQLAATVIDQHHQIVFQ